MWGEKKIIDIFNTNKKLSFLSIGDDDIICAILAHSKYFNITDKLFRLNLEKIFKEEYQINILLKLLKSDSFDKIENLREYFSESILNSQNTISSEDMLALSLIDKNTFKPNDIKLVNKLIAVYGNYHINENEEMIKKIFWGHIKMQKILNEERSIKEKHFNLKKKKTFVHSGLYIKTDIFKNYSYYCPMVENYILSCDIPVLEINGNIDSRFKRLCYVDETNEQCSPEVFKYMNLMKLTIYAVVDPNIFSYTLSNNYIFGISEKKKIDSMNILNDLLIKLNNLGDLDINISVNLDKLMNLVNN